MVTDGPKVRFYAGFPGRCARTAARSARYAWSDQAPRQFSEDEQALLRDLAGMVAHEVAADELQKILREKRENEIWLRGLLDNAPDGVMLIDEDGAILSMNPGC